MAEVAPQALSQGVTILLEPLAPHLVEEISSPALRTMFDTHNAAAEREPHGEKRSLAALGMTVLGTFTGERDFAAVLQALHETVYSG